MKVATSFVVLLISVAASLEDEKFEEENNEDYNEHPRYNYEYGVHDPTTKDIKKHWETRDGDFVKGSYRFVQPDGSLRIVDYNSDDNGFNAFVKYEGLGEHQSAEEEAPARESYQSPVHSENLHDSFDFNFLPEEYVSTAPPSVEKENEESLNAPQKNKSIHSYEGKGRDKVPGKGYEVEENPESNENAKEQEAGEEESD